MQFVEFLGKWLSEIGRVTGKDTAATYIAYMHRIHEFNGHATKITGDIYWRRSRFVRLTEEFASLLPGNINNDAGDCRDVIASRIREFIRITR